MKMAKKLLVVLGPDSEEMFRIRKEIMTYSLNRFQKTCERIHVVFILAAMNGKPVTEETANLANGYLDIGGKARKRSIPIRAKTILVGCKSDVCFKKTDKVIPFEKGEGRLLNQVRDLIEKELPTLF